MLRSVAAHGPSAVAQLVRFGEDYRALWRAGTIDGPDMANLVEAWIAWLRSLGVNPQADATLQALIRSHCFRRLWETSPGLACDEAFTGMMNLFIQSSRAQMEQTFAV